MDPLSDLLSLLKPKSSVSAGFDAGGDWSIQFSNPEERIKCYAIVSGTCFLVVDGVADPVRLTAGDAFVLPGGRDFRLTSDPALTPEDASRYLPAPQKGGMVPINGGGGVFLVGSRFILGGAHAALMLGLLPPIIHLRAESERLALRWLVERTMQELRDALPGHDLIARHLAHMMLILALRLHLEENTGPGWFGALSDRHLRAAVAAIHAEPARRWTVTSLAQTAAMSRSSFALRFSKLAGETPMNYLARWRMFLAVDRLETGATPLATIAQDLGYASESSFSTAFKRIMGRSPRQFTRTSR